jgi:catechol 2,3-dioxygenase-like lactoylglutathione lyase family enzyme
MRVTGERRSDRMKVKRIVANVAAADVSKARGFYADILGLNLTMDLGWIATFEAPTHANPQLSVAAQGGSGTAVPDLSIEVDDLDEALGRIRAAGIPIEYGPVSEDWGVRRFYVKDPFGRLVNILTHE